MIYVGIDIAKLNHNVAVLSSDGLVLTEPFKHTNDGNRFKRLSAEFSAYPPKSVICLESTAHDGDNLVRYLVVNDYKVCVLPLFRLRLGEKIVSTRQRPTKSTL